MLGVTLLWMPTLPLLTIVLGPRFGYVLVLCPLFAFALLPMATQWKR